MKNITNVLCLLLVLCQTVTAQITLTSANAPVARTGHRTRDMEVESNHILSAYPSPANHITTLDVDVQTAAKVVAIIVSTSGQTVKARNLGDLQVGKQQVDFDVTDLPSGSYQIILLSDKGKLGNQKIVVTH